MLRAGSDGHVTLVAMPPSGEVFLVRDFDDVLWLISPPGAGGPERVDDEVVERALTDHGFELIDESFAGWEQLDRERQRRAGIGAPVARVDVDGFDVEDVERVLHTAERWRARGQTLRARRIAHRLLDAPVVLTDTALHHRLVRFLQQLDETPPSMPAPVADPGQADVRARMSLVAP